MRELFAAQLGPMIAKLSASTASAASSATAGGANTVDAASSVDVATRAGLVATQALGFALCRYVLALPPVANLSREEAVAWLGPTITRYLTGTP